MNTLQKIGYWKKMLELEAWSIKAEKISRFAVYDEEKDRRNIEYVGVDINRYAKRAVILHTRKLTHEDICHELLHIACPNYNEDEINTLMIECLAISSQIKHDLEALQSIQNSISFLYGE